MSNVVTWIIKAVDQFSDTYDQMNKHIAESEKRIIKFNSQVNEIGKSARSAMLKVSAPILAFGGLGMKAWMDKKNQLDLMEQTIERMGDKAPLSFKQIMDAANQLELNTLYTSNDVINDVMHNMIRLGDIAPENLLSAQDAIVDFAAQTSMSLDAATSVFTRALQRPTTGVRFFEQRLGTLDPKIKTLINDLVEVGRVSEAQAILIDIAAQKTAGAAERARENQPFTVIGQAMERIAENFAKELSPGFTRFADMIGNLSFAFEALSPKTREFIGFSALMIAALPIVVFSLTKVITAFTGLYLMMKKIRVLLLAFSPFLLVAAAITAIGVALYKTYKQGGAFTEWVNNTIDHLKSLFGWIKDGLSLLDEFLQKASIFNSRGVTEGRSGLLSMGRSSVEDSVSTIDNILTSGRMSSETNANLKITVDDDNSIVKATQLESDGPMHMNVGQNMMGGFGGFGRQEAY